MNPVERFRAAATRLREVAADATTGPWSVTREHLTHPEAGADVQGAGGRWVASDCDGYQGGCLPADADYIAMMHPPVALALADWLDDLAAGWPWDDDGTCVWDDGTPMRLEESPDTHALAVADAVLGGEQR